MNTLDIVILALFIPGVIKGLSKGFLEQGISIAGIVLSLYLAPIYSGTVASWLQGHVNVSDGVLNILAFALVLLAVLVVVMIFAKLVTKAIEMASLGWLNKVLGIIFAVGLTAVIIGVVIILFDTVNSKFGLVNAPMLEESMLYNALKDFGYGVFPYLQEIFSKQAVG